MRRLTMAMIALGLTFASAHGAVSAQTFNFTINPSQSGFQGAASLELTASGSLIGNYNSSTNPSGTRTLPSGTNAKSTANLPISIAPVLALGGPIQTSEAGTFTLTLDIPHHKATLQQYQADLSAGGPISLSASIIPNSAAFITRNPTFAYPAFTSALPLGNITLESLKIAQNGTPSHGVLKLVSGATYSFAVVFKAEYTIDLNVEGKVMPLAFSAPVVLSGRITLSNGGAQIAASSDHQIDRTAATSKTISSLPLSLPALPGQPADVLLTLTANHIGLDLGGAYTLIADGTETP